MSDCVLHKSICNEEGQIAYKDDSTKDDRTCRCDNENHYSFIKPPKNNLFCKPSEEDCSCFIKPCLVNYTLSSGKYQYIIVITCFDVIWFSNILLKRKHLLIGFQSIHTFVYVKVFELHLFRIGEYFFSIFSFVIVLIMLMINFQIKPS